MNRTHMPRSPAQAVAHHPPDECRASVDGGLPLSRPLCRFGLLWIKRATPGRRPRRSPGAARFLIQERLRRPHGIGKPTLDMRRACLGVVAIGGRERCGGAVSGDELIEHDAFAREGVPHPAPYQLVRDVPCVLQAFSGCLPCVSAERSRETGGGVRQQPDQLVVVVDDFARVESGITSKIRNRANVGERTLDQDHVGPGGQVAATFSSPHAAIIQHELDYRSDRR